MKKLTLPRLKSLAPQPKKKVQKLAANAAHRLTPPAFEDYDEEPSTKLSTAFVVVLILHLVAVGGIYAFHSIKAHRKGTEAPVQAEAAKVAPPVAAAQPAPATAPAATPPKSTPAPVVQPKVATPAPVAVQAPTQTPAPKVAPTKPDSGPSAVIPQTKSPVASPVAQVQATPVASHNEAVPGAAATAVSGKTYKVMKGDNPVVIAKRLGVSEEELLKLNGISDPKKLQIGQELKIPAKKGAN